MGADLYRLYPADRIVIPDEENANIIMRSGPAARTYQVQRLTAAIRAGPAGKGAHGLAANAFAFCISQQSYQADPATFALWMRIPKQSGNGGVLWLLENNIRDFPGNMRREADVSQA